MNGKRRPDRGIQTVSVAMLADIAEVAADRPSPQLRRTVLAQIRAATAQRPMPSTTEVPAAAGPYAAQVAELDTLLAGLSGEQWQTPVVNDWDVAGVLGHLVAVDAIAADAVGLPTPPRLGVGDDVAERTRWVQRAHEGQSRDALYRAWRGQAIALLRLAAARADRLDASIPYLGLPLATADVLADRAAETWVHGQDIRVALELPPLAPQPGHLSMLAGVGARVLAATWAPGATGGVLLHLTGAGACDWLIDPAGEGAPATGPVGAEVSLDCLEFCYLLGGRRSVSDVNYTISGDPALALAALTAATRLARL